MAPLPPAPAPAGAWPRTPLALHAQRGQLVDVEEAPVVDLVAGHAPVRQAVGLRVDQGVERVEARALADASVELSPPSSRPGAGADAAKAPPGAPSAGSCRGCRARGPRARRLRAAAAGPAPRPAPAPLARTLRPRRSRCSTRAAAAVGGRIERQPVLVVAQREVAAAGVEDQLQLAALEHDAVLVAEHGQQHLAAQGRVGGPPVDVEVVGIGRRRPFSSTSSHQALSPPSTPMWLGTMSTSSPMPCACSCRSPAGRSRRACRARD
jgi:hypothetical protein